MASYKVNANGDQVCITIPVKNSSATIPATGVLVNLNIPAGLTYSSIPGNPSVPVGTYSTLNNRWTVGGIPVNQTYIAQVCLTVTDITEAPFTITSVVSLNESDVIIPNNTRTDVITNGYCPGCAQPPQIQVDPKDDLTQCVCHNVASNDINCGGGYTTMYELVEGSEVNLDSVSLDEYSGAGRVVLLDPNSEWSYQYEIRCKDCVTGVVSDAYGPATVSGPPIFTAQINNNNYLITTQTGNYTQINDCVTNYSYYRFDTAGGNIIFTLTNPSTWCRNSITVFRFETGAGTPANTFQIVTDNVARTFTNNGLTSYDIPTNFTNIKIVYIGGNKFDILT